jgi:hypothetical protein
MSTKLRAELMAGVGSLAADPSAPFRTATNCRQSPVSVLERLEAGNLSIDEVCALANRSKTGFYADLKAGLVTIRKVGRKSIIPGPVAKRYIAGEPVAV